MQHSERHCDHGGETTSEGLHRHISPETWFHQLSKAGCNTLNSVGTLRQRAIVFQRFLLADFKLTRLRLAAKDFASSVQHSRSRARVIGKHILSTTSNQTCLQQTCPSSVHVLHLSLHKKKDVSRISREPSRHTCLATTGNKKKTCRKQREREKKNIKQPSRTDVEVNRHEENFFLKKSSDQISDGVSSAR